jgi:hypothetical protein
MQRHGTDCYHSAKCYPGTQRHGGFGCDPVRHNMRIHSYTSKELIRNLRLGIDDNHRAAASLRWSERSQQQTANKLRKIPDSDIIVQ